MNESTNAEFGGGDDARCAGRLPADDTADALPVGSAGVLSSGWWGMIATIVTEGSLFGYLLFSYLYLAVQTPGRWPPEGLPKIGVGALSTAVLLSSSVFVWLCERFVRRRRVRLAVASIALAIVLGALFVSIQVKEWHDHPYGMKAHLYGSLYFTITGFHLAHVAVGLFVLVFLLLWTALGYFDAQRCAALRIGGLYWHFVDVVWLFIFTTLYVLPFLVPSASAAQPGRAAPAASESTIETPPTVSGAPRLASAAPSAGSGTGSAQPVRDPFTEPALIARGAYLAKLGDCAGCHTSASRTPGHPPIAGLPSTQAPNQAPDEPADTDPDTSTDTASARPADASSESSDRAAHDSRPGGIPFAGGLAMGSPFGTIYTTNITPDRDTGIGRYSFDDFARVLREGVAPGGRRLYPAMPFPSFARMTDDDLRALYAYFMHGVPPVHSTPPPTRLPFPFNQRWALTFWDFAFVPNGPFVPRTDRDAQWNRGAYLVQVLGHCGACHTPRGPAYEERGYDESSSRYLSGGINDHWFAPNLTGDPGSGLGRLREDDIVSFLRTGHGAGLVTFGSMVQVVEDSTQYMSEDDLHAIAHYLKALPAREPSGAYAPRAPAAAQSVAALRTGAIERPGAGVYMGFCAKCHQADGRGVPRKYPALAGNPAVLAPESASLIRLLVEGGNSPDTQHGPRRRKMPAFAGRLTDTEIARVLTFVRSTWGNVASPVTTRDVRLARDALHK